MEKIGSSNGIEAARKRENEFHPGLTAWDTRSHTLQLLVGDVNGLIDVEARQDGQITTLIERVAALEARPAVPFPGVSS